MELKIINVMKTFEKKKTIVSVLNNINLLMQQEDFIAIIGRSGCGKTTLLNIIGGLIKPTTGSVEVNKLRLEAMTEYELCEYRNKTIGYVFQTFNLLPTLTVRENIELPQRTNEPEYIDDLLKLLELTDKEHDCIEHLSGGEQQRVAIARALVNHPDFILADEPTGSLDHISERKVIELFEKCIEKYKTSIILVTHNMEIASCAKRIYEIREGELYEYSKGVECNLQGCALS
jgi:putative ABC transport system ATP-binding protein